MEGMNVLKAQERASLPEEEGALWRLGAAEAAAMIRDRLISSRELTLSVLERLEATNPNINAIVLHRPEEALDAAEAADRAVKREGVLGSLHGVPVTIKLNVDQAGYPNDRGSIALRDVIALTDNPVVTNLRTAGAVFVGRTNAPCYLMRWFTDNTLYGRTLNPWDAATTPGGSSGGASAALASGIGALALGNDIAGSIRYPAYCCGVFGLKPSVGRVPSHNESGAGFPSIAAQLMSVQGPLARNVADLRLGLAAMAKPHWRDPNCIAVAPGAPLSKPIRVALAADSGDVHPAVAEAIRTAGRLLTEAGYQVEERVPPLYAESAQLWAKIATGDILNQLWSLMKDSEDDAIQTALSLWKEILPPGDAATTLAGVGLREEYLRRWHHFLSEYPIVVMPVSNEPPFEADADVRDVATTRRIFAAQGPMMAISALGLPAVAAPLGFYKGVPLGVQIVGAPYREDLCLDAAQIIEEGSPPLYPITPRTGT
jgi:amidase